MIGGMGWKYALLVVVCWIAIIGVIFVAVALDPHVALHAHGGRCR